MFQRFQMPEFRRLEESQKQKMNSHVRKLLQSKETKDLLLDVKNALMINDTEFLHTFFSELNNTKDTEKIKQIYRESLFNFFYYNGYNMPLFSLICSEYLFKFKNDDIHLARNERGETIFHVCARNFLNDTLEFLIKSSLSKKTVVELLNSRDSHNNTPLITTIHAFNKHAAKIFLENGANPNVKDTEGNSCLHECAKYGNIEIALMLIQHNADTDTVNNQGQTHLHIAAINAQPEYLMHFVKKSQDLTQEDYHGKTIIDYLIQNDNLNVDLLLHFKNKFNLDLNSRDSRGKSLLVNAINNKAYNSITALKELGCKLSLYDMAQVNIFNLILFYFYTLLKRDI
ncbi:MAG: ankyrin repeat domain-containing protein [Candidatus Micrarchaeota archaeon]|nr:ankyrin repeat domain-containing protein [Candidatus Micrarchaeota archaeon]